MKPKVKNIILFVAIALILVLIYVFFVKSSPDDTPALSSAPAGPFAPTQVNTSASQPIVAEEFLSLLLSVKNITLDTTIFSEDAFIRLDDSSITLIPDGNEGRPNPFAPIGSDPVDTSIDESDLDLGLDSDLDLDLDLGDLIPNEG